MSPITVERFAHLAGGELHGFGVGASIRGFATDHREVRPGDLFLAIRGARVDGHDFVADALEKGAVGAIVERQVDGPHILVPNLVDALAIFASGIRSTFTGPVIGITGSAGKTTAKEFIAAALSPLGEIVKTEGNRNTEYTSPLLWAEVGPDTKAVVVEMAMRGFGQIAHLAAFSKPTIGVVTNVGYSHLSEVGTRDGIAKAKAELLQSLPKDGLAILWQSDDYLAYLRSNAPRRTLTFGINEGGAEAYVHKYEPVSWTKSRIGLCVGDETFHLEMPGIGSHIALGVAAALLVAKELEVPLDSACRAIEKVRLPGMRMEVAELNGATILLDTYNAAPPSMLAAIETFCELPCDGRRIAVIGEMRELGDYTEQAHRELGVTLAKSGIDEAIFYSGPAALSAEEARMHGMVVHLVHSLQEIADYLSRIEPADRVLVKGSRSLELEKAVEMARLPAGAGC